MSTTSSMTMDVQSMLRFPSKTRGLSAYRPKLAESVGAIANTSPISGSGSPPRKTARLDGDSDHSASITRARQKGKEKESLAETEGVLKLTITNPSENDISEEYLDSLLPKIHKAICAMLERPPPGGPYRPLNYERVYQATRTTVLIAKKGQWVYDKLKFELKEAASKASRHLTTLRTATLVDWVEELVAAATWLDESVKLLGTALTYLDRIFVAQNPGTQHVRELAMGLFNAHVFQHALVQQNIRNAVKEWASWERNERRHHPKRPSIVGLAHVLSDYSLFTDCFLSPYVEETRNFYTAESEQESVKLKASPDMFVVHCGTRIDEEYARSSETLAAFKFCWSEIEKTTEKALMDGRLKWLSLGIVHAIDGKNTEGLARMYNLFARVEGQKLLCEAFKAHVHNRVSGIVKDVEHDEEMVDRLLDFKDYIDTVLPIAFSDPEPHTSTHTSEAGHASTSTTPLTKKPAKKVVNRDFMYAATDSFTTGFRVRRNKPAEMIAKFLDRAMRRGQKGASDEEFEKNLDSLLGLYRFTQDKDVFRTFYHRALAKRLLLQRSASDDFEKAVLKKLKEHYDPEFSMGDNMFRDLALSRDFMREFHERSVGSGTAQNLSVMVLQRSFWPFAAKVKEQILLPPNMQSDLMKYASFYKNKHQGHKLDFDHSLGTVQIHARFKAGPKELSVSLYQAVVLLLFNEQEEIGFTDIKLNTEIEDGDLRRTLQSLACANKKVLKKRPVGRDVSDSDLFYFNADFTDPRPKVHINSIQTKETPEESQKTQSGIEGDRKHYLDAAIVRVMKAKKTMGHQPLITATIDAVKAHFAPEVRMIKERIEQLIEQEYMRRDATQENVYVYVA